MRLRSDFRTAVTMMNRLHRESGEERDQSFFNNTKGGTRLLPVRHGGIVIKLVELIYIYIFLKIFCCSGFVYS